MPPVYTVHSIRSNLPLTRPGPYSIVCKVFSNIDCESQFSYVDVLENDDVRASLPKVSDWPTFPQVFINGELVGGADIIAQMHETGELKKLIDSVES